MKVLGSRKFLDCLCNLVYTHPTSTAILRINDDNQLHLNGISYNSRPQRASMARKILDTGALIRTTDHRLANRYPQAVCEVVSGAKDKKHGGHLL